MNLNSKLSELESAQLVHRTDDDELAYLFKHALLQDTAYGSLLRPDRRRLHLSVGSALERMYPDQLDELAALLARHFAVADEREKAIAYARRAAQHSIARYAYEEAVQHLNAVLDLIEPDEASEIHLTLLEETADIYRLLRDAARAIILYQRALDVWSKLKGAERFSAVRLHRKIIQVVAEARWVVNLDFYQKAAQIRAPSRSSLEKEIETLQLQSPHPETVEALTALSMDAWRVQSPPDWDTAFRFAQNAVAMAEQLHNPVLLSRALDALSSVNDARGELRVHLQVALRRLAITRAKEFDNLREKIDALRGAGMAHLYVGEYREALPHLTDAEKLADNIQAIELGSYAIGLQSHCWFRLDQWDQVLLLEEKWRDLERRYARERIDAT